MTEIVTAVQRGSQVHVHGPSQRQLCAVFAGKGPKDGLAGLHVEHPQRSSRQHDLRLQCQGAAAFEGIRTVAR